MVTAPQGMAVGLPGPMAAGVGGLVGGPAAPASAPLPSGTPQLGATIIGGGNTPGVATTGAAGAALGIAMLRTGAIVGGGGPASTTPAMPLATTLLGATPTVVRGSPHLLVPSNVVTTTPGAAIAGAGAAPDAAPGAAPGAATPAPARLTTVAPGGNQGDADLVERTLGVLRGSPAGAQVVDRLLAVGAKVNVISDAEFQSMGHGDSHAFYDPKIDTMFLRRSDLADTSAIRFAAVALAHEGTHLLDDVAGIAEPMVREIEARVASAGGLGTAAGIEARDQGLFELTMVKETRAFLFAGQVARELGMQLPATDPTSTAIAGGNDQATFTAVWERLLRSSYNPTNRTALPRNL